MISLNKATIIGNLTRDPESKALPSGITVVNFSIATNRNWKDKEGNKKEEVQFHNCVSFGKQADTIAQYVKKGQQLMVEGRIQTRSWEVEGGKRYATEIMVEQFQFGAKAGDGKTESKPEEDTIKDTDIPF
jgi:single-strand DNA-binding protein